MIIDLYKKFLQSSGVETDTRKHLKNKIFFALKGENFNGNQYAEKAIELGAQYVVIDEKKFQKNDNFLLVDDVLETLQDLAAHHRGQLKIPVLGITGSNGKTTTKELINAVLSTKYKTFATMGNFNNHIGVPLSLLSITEETQIAIIEMGANRIGEIANYCKWVKPTLGLITNIGNAHLEGFGSFENIIIAKSELLEDLKKSNKIIFFNEDDETIKEIVKDYTYKISYGTHSEVDTRVSLVQSFPTLEIVFEEKKIRTNLFGEYNFYNISAAIALASYFDIPLSFIKIGLENYIPKNNRSEIRKIGNNLVILDAYNANPTSVKAAISSFARLNVQNKILIIGDMFELGKDSLFLHQETVEYANTFQFDKIVFVGNEFFTSKTTNNIFFKSTDEATIWFQKQNFQSATILIKGSRGMKMELLIE